LKLVQKWALKGHANTLSLGSKCKNPREKMIGQIVLSFMSEPFVNSTKP